MKTKHPTLGRVEKTCRNFEIIEFKDYYDKECSVQVSSVIIEKYPDAFEKPGTSALWIGQGDERMHLNREQARVLCNIINSWLATGKLAYDKSVLEM